MKTRNPILETRIIPVAHPTNNQKAVMAKIVAGPTPELAAAEISDTPNLAAARDMLDRLGMIELNDEGAHLTDEGKEVMINQALMSPTGQLTSLGRDAAHGSEAQREPEPDPGADLDVGMDLDTGPDLEGGQDEEGGVELDLDIDESFSLMKALRLHAISESLNMVPKDVLDQLTPNERVALRSVLDDQADLMDFYDLYSKLFQYYSTEMPYGVAKARTGEPDKWIIQKLMGETPVEDEIY